MEMERIVCFTILIIWYLKYLQGNHKCVCYICEKHLPFLPFPQEIKLQLEPITLAIIENKCYSLAT